MLASVINALSKPVGARIYKGETIDTPTSDLSCLVIVDRQDYLLFQMRAHNVEQLGFSFLCMCVLCFFAQHSSERPPLAQSDEYCEK